MKFKALTLCERMHSNGTPIDSMVVVAAWHWPSSITWRWSFTRQKVKSPRKLPLFNFTRTHKGRGFNFHFCLYSPLLGIWNIQTQPNMWRQKPTHKI